MKKQLLLGLVLVVSSGLTKAAVSPLSSPEGKALYAFYTGRGGATTGEALNNITLLLQDGLLTNNEFYRNLLVYCQKFFDGISRKTFAGTFSTPLRIHNKLLELNNNVLSGMDGAISQVQAIQGPGQELNAIKNLSYYFRRFGYYLQALSNAYPV